MAECMADSSPNLRDTSRLGMKDRGMPDETGKLTEVDKQRVEVIVRRPGFKCPVCAGTDWIVPDHLVQMTTLGANNAIQLGGIGYPHAMAISTTCGLIPAALTAHRCCPGSSGD
jgi:hypothetical protein